MKKILFLFLSFALFFVSCKEKHNYEKEIIGKWLCQEENNFFLPTNDAFVINFKTNNSLMKAMGYSIAEDSTFWKECSLTYEINDDKLIINGKNGIGANVHETYTIGILTNSKLALTSGKTTFICYKIIDNFFNQLVGTWKGIETFSGDSIEIYCGVNGGFIQKRDGNEEINGNFTLYGNLLAVNYGYSTTENLTAHAYENWLLTFDKNNKNKVQFLQYIAGTDVNFTTRKFELYKVDP